MHCTESIRMVRGTVENMWEQRQVAEIDLSDPQQPPKPETLHILTPCAPCGKSRVVMICDG